MDRRSMLKAAGSAAALTVLGIPVGAAAAEVTPVPKKMNRKKLRSVKAETKKLHKLEKKLTR